jgi:hypothetical protein
MRSKTFRFNLLSHNVFRPRRTCKVTSGFVLSTKIVEWAHSGDISAHLVLRYVGIQKLSYQFHFTPCHYSVTAIFLEAKLTTNMTKYEYIFWSFTMVTFSLIFLFKKIKECSWDHFAVCPCIRLYLCIQLCLSFCVSAIIFRLFRLLRLMILPCCVSVYSP